MQFIPYVILGILGIVLLILCLRQRKRLKNARVQLEELMQKQKKDLENYYSDISARATQKFEKEKTSYENQLSLLRIQLDEKKKAIDSNLEIYRKGEYEKLDREIRLKKYQAFQDANDVVKIFENEATENIEKTFSRVAEARSEYEEILKILEDFRARREVVNSQILREKELQEEKDFFRICVEEEDKTDLYLIKEIEGRFNNKEVLHKAAYDCYIKRPTQEMIKRVLKGRKVSGIYCITYMPTGELYIGRSTDIGSRWSEHTKSAYNIGSIAHSSLHTKMARDGIWNFQFQILEEVPKDKLNEREKYWIDVYGAQNLLNQKAGG